MRKIVSAVSFMHARGVVHRDIKPEVCCWFLMKQTKNGNWTVLGKISSSFQICIVQQQYFIFIFLRSEFVVCWPYGRCGDQDNWLWFCESESSQPTSSDAVFHVTLRCSRSPGSNYQTKWIRRVLWPLEFRCYIGKVYRWIQVDVLVLIHHTKAVTLNFNSEFPLFAQSWTSASDNKRGCLYCCVSFISSTRCCQVKFHFKEVMVGVTLQQISWIESKRAILNLTDSNGTLCHKMPGILSKVVREGNVWGKLSNSSSKL
jgi:hypothetical protein